MRKLGYRIDSQGYYIPQYTNAKNEWIDFKVKNIGFGELYRICYDLSIKGVYHYAPDPRRDQKEEDMQLIFKNAMRVGAFLGAVKAMWETDKTVEFEI